METTRKSICRKCWLKFCPTFAFILYAGKVLENMDRTKTHSHTQSLYCFIVRHMPLCWVAAFVCVFVLSQLCWFRSTLCISEIQRCSDSKAVKIIAIMFFSMDVYFFFSFLFFSLTRTHHFTSVLFLTIREYNGLYLDDGYFRYCCCFAFFHLIFC